jgi:hypothetical protein
MLKININTYMDGNDKVAKSGLVGKVLKEVTTMCNDYSKRTKGCKNLGRIEDNHEQQREL